jgi:hypothetical protein
MPCTAESNIRRRSNSKTLKKELEDQGITVRAETPLSVAGAAKGKKTSVPAGNVKTTASEIKQIQIKMQKASPAKMDLRATLDYNLKRKIVQLELAKKKKKQLEDEEMTVAVIDELQDVRMEIRDIEKDMKKYHKKLDELANTDIIGDDNRDEA